MEGRGCPPKKPKNIKLKIEQTKAEKESTGFLLLQLVVTVSSNSN
jgi:hypothetical protein